jgi:hypothetical protein
MVGFELRGRSEAYVNELGMPIAARVVEPAAALRDGVVGRGRDRAADAPSFVPPAA